MQVLGQDQAAAVACCSPMVRKPLGEEAAVARLSSLLEAPADGRSG
ncbi:hypothetical protein ACIA98_17510 [Streptomyces sp. NPDC051366]